MKLTKEIFVHNRLYFDETEVDALTTASKIISKVRQENIHSSGAEDEYLNRRCEDILEGIAELLDSYSNEYTENDK